ncbi:Aste57867_22977 [Aphanomyces stellatus]|uniref:Aste57867_22977 protein n=1 Tax=Aphanomyces stellatus TaxID=120398 RepID=A0A485LLH1_9STRA|nr:hypothetical protein As57867_022906 [Aphanomyces stellatus]VFT99627.1 Aste57867_22977 [Aphanomyces stellatus]
MLGRFFNKKEEPKASRPPHAVGPPQARPPAAAEESGAGGGGGGFFNLPPPVSSHPGGAAPQPQGFTNPNNAYNQSPAKTQGVAGLPQPSYGGLNPNNPYQRPGVPPAQPGGAAPSLFGGMNVKQSTEHAPPPSMPLGGGGGSLFSGLDLGGSASAPSPPVSNASPMSLSALNIPSATPIVPEATAPKRGPRSSGFNYLDVAPPDAAAAPSPPLVQIPIPKGVTKKKKPSFRPGFGRQLSEESIAALQRGDLKDEDVVAEDTAAPPPPLAKSTSSGGSKRSVLSGLTVHAPDDPPTHTTTSGSSKSILSGMTVQRASTGSDNLSSLLEGMAIRNIATGATIKPLSGAAPSTSSARTLSPRGSTGSSMLASSPRHGKAPTPRKSLPSFATQLAASAVPPPTTPAERVAAIIRDFDAAAAAFTAGMAQFKGEEAHIGSRKEVLTKQIAQYTLDLHEVEASQVQAAEDEDFEKADALNATIEKIRHIQMLSQSDLRKCEQDLGQMAKQKEKLVLAHVRSAKGALNAITKFEDERATAYADLATEARTFKQTERRRFAFEQQRVATELHHVTVNMGHLNDEKAEIEGSIAAQCVDEVESRAALLEEKDTVVAEIEALEAKLAALRAHVVELDAGIATADAGIQVVRNKFSRQLKRLSDREKSILKTKKEVEADELAMHRQEEAFAAKKDDFSAKLKALATQVLSVQTELRVAAIVVKLAEDQNSARQAKDERAKKHEAQLKSLRDEAAESEKHWTLLKNQQADLQKKLNGFRTLIMTAGTTLPQLEAEKKAAAAERNFKEAARLSKDIKQLEKDRAGADEQIEVLGMEIKDLDERIATRAADYEAKTAAFDEMEKSLELATLDGLYDAHHDLRVVMRQLTKYESPSWAAGVDFRATTLALVQAEFDAVVSEIEVLEDKHNVEPFVKDLADEVPEKPLVLLEEAESDDDVTAAEAAAAATDGHDVAPRESIDAARMSLDASGALPSVAALTADALVQKIAQVEGEIEAATENEDYELAAHLDEELEEWKERLAAAQAETKKEAASGPSDAQLRAELETLQDTIKALAGQIEHATEEEEYEIAAHLDEELVAAQTRKTEIQLQLAQNDAEDEGRRPVVHQEDEAPVVASDSVAETEVVDDEAEHAEPDHDVDDDDDDEEYEDVHSPPTESTPSLFAGLESKPAGALFGGLSIAPATSPDAASAAPTSLFGGLSLGSSSTVPSSAPLFGGLTVTAAPIESNDHDDEEAETSVVVEDETHAQVDAHDDDDDAEDDEVQVDAKEEEVEVEVDAKETEVEEDQEADRDEEHDVDAEEEELLDEEAHEEEKVHEEEVMHEEKDIHGKEGQHDVEEEESYEEDEETSPEPPAAAPVVETNGAAVVGGSLFAGMALNATDAPSTGGRSLFGGLSVAPTVTTDDDAASEAPASTSLFGGQSMLPKSPIVLAPVDSTLEGPRSPSAMSPTTSLFGGLSLASTEVAVEPNIAMLGTASESTLFGGLSLAPPQHPAMIAAVKPLEIPSPLADDDHVVIPSSEHNGHAAAAADDDDDE